MFSKSDLIHSYSRTEALRDGTLIDAGPLAVELGFKVPIALTCGAYAECIRVREDSSDQDEHGRLWDVLWLMHLAVRRLTHATQTVTFEVIVRNGRRKSRVTLKAHCGPNDDGSPCVTVMLADED